MRSGRVASAHWGSSLLNIRGRIAVGLCTALVASGVAFGGGVASAADKNCKDFTSQATAQSYFDANGGSKTNNFNDLDRDHDGVACQDYPYGAGSGGTGTGGTGTNAGGSTTGTGTGSTAVNCQDFPTQAAAQAYLEQDSTDPAGLDGDNDGMACDDYFARTTGAGTLDDGSTAVTSGSQVVEVPQGSADTGSW